MSSIADEFKFNLMTCAKDTYFFDPSWENKKLLATFRLTMTPLGNIQCYYRGDKNRGIVRAKAFIRDYVTFDDALRTMLSYETDIYARGYLQAFESSKYSHGKIVTACILLGIKLGGK